MFHQIILYSNIAYSQQMEGDQNLLDDAPQQQPVARNKKKVPLVYTWGKNQDGQLGVRGTKNAFQPSSCRGLRGYARQVATARSHTVVLNDQGHIYLAGSLLFGKIGITAQVNNFREFRMHQQMSQFIVKKVACGDYHTLALVDDGTVYSWGGTLWDKTGHKGGGISRMEKLVDQKIVDIACGDFHSIALTSQGKVYSWGGGGQNKNKGQLGHKNKQDLPHPEQIKFFKDIKIAKIACGDYHTMVMTTKNQLYAFGQGSMGQLGTGGKQDCATPSKVKMNFEIALQEYFRSDINQQTTIEQMALGGHHSLLLTNKGHVYACGYGSQGQLGLGIGQTDNKFQPTLVRVLLGKQIVMLAAGANHSLALSSKHDVYVCGYNAKGQLGLGQQKSVTVWTHNTQLQSKNVGRIYAGGDHSWAVIDQVSPFIEDYQPPSPIRLNIQEPTMIKNYQSDSRPQKSALSGNSMDDILISLTPTRKLQMIVSQVQFSHRFIHFTVKESCKNLEDKISEYLEFVCENQRRWIKFHRVTQDVQMFDAKGKLLHGANSKGSTIMLVAQIPETATEYLNCKQNKTAVAIGDIFMMDSASLRVQGNKIPLHNMWFFKFHEIFEDVLQRARFIELRPKLI